MRLPMMLSHLLTAISFRHRENREYSNNIKLSLIVVHFIGVSGICGFAGQMPVDNIYEAYGNDTGIGYCLAYINNDEIKQTFFG